MATAHVDVMVLALLRGRGADPRMLPLSQRLVRPALRRLERCGLVVRRDGLRYRVTRAGEEALRVRLLEWRTISGEACR
jgi:DNA-binding PadR family transcriptional regulator